MSKRAATTSDDAPTRKKRKAVTTQSILNSFLLLKTTLDDTVLRSELIEDLDIGNGSGTKGQKKKSLASHPCLPYILKDINQQRLEIRDKVKSDIEAFANAYDKQPQRASKFDIQPDEQKELLKEELSLDEAVAKLREMEKSLKTEVASLEKGIKKHEKALTKAVDLIVGLHNDGKQSVDGQGDSTRHSM